jgi:hypothetical protein
MKKSEGLVNSNDLADYDTRARWQQRPPSEFPSPWASEWGFDKFGLWQSLIVKEVSYRFRFISHGTFVRDLPDMEPTINEIKRDVTISEGFWLGETTITHELFHEVMGTGLDDEHFDVQFKDKPISNISVHDFKDLFEAIKKQQPNINVTLPSEVQWEYACRAGSSTKFSTGDHLNSQQANFSFDAQSNAIAKVVNVKTYPANKWGLYEMHGNVWEYCIASDLYSTGEFGNLVLRGGSCFSDENDCRSSYRIDSYKEILRKNKGLRVLVADSNLIDNSVKPTFFDRDTIENNDEQGQFESKKEAREAAQNKNFKLSIKLYLDILEKHVLNGESWLDIANIQYELSDIYIKTNELVNAIALLNDVYNVRKDKLGDMNKLTLEVMVKMANLYQEHQYVNEEYSSRSYSLFSELSFIHETANRLPKAIQFAMDQLDIIYMLNDDPNLQMAKILLRISHLHEKSMNYSSAVFWCKQALETCENSIESTSDDIEEIEEELASLRDSNLDYISQRLSLNIEHGEISNAIQDRLSTVIEELMIYPEADGFPTPECEESYCLYIDHELSTNSKNQIDYENEYVDENEYILTVTTEVFYEITASFSFSVRDSIDKDYVTVGKGRVITKKYSYETAISITLQGNFEEESFDSSEVEVESIEVLKTIENSDVNFGYIEPFDDFDDDID